MRFVPTKLHAPLDYIVGAGLIAAPWIFQFSDLTTVLSIVLGIGLIVYSLFTNYELGLWKVALGFADASANVWVPHLVVGLAAIFLGLTTKQSGGYSYRAPSVATR